MNNLDSRTDRVRILVRYAIGIGLAPTQEKLGILLGYTNKNTISHLMNGRKKPTQFAKKLKVHIPSLNLDWVESGVGNMLDNQNVTAINNGTVSGVMTTAHTIITEKEKCNCEKTSESSVPVIPRHIYENTEIDTYEYVTEKVTPTSPRIKQLPKYSMCYPVYSDELSPNIIAGDRLYIDEHVNMRKIIDGKPYVIDTTTNGLLLRILYKGDTGYKASSTSSKYRDEYIPYEDVVRVYRILGMLRANF
jgi:hypothetical protein